MGQVMLDVMNLGFNRNVVMRLESLLDRSCAADVSDFLPHQFRMWPVRQDKAEPAPVVDSWFAIDRDMIDVAPGQAAFCQAIIDRSRRQAGPMFDPAKPFLFCRGDESAID